MTTVAIGTYCRFKDRAGTDQNFNIQNFHSGQSRLFGGISYTFANYGYSGSTADSSGANTSAQLVFATNQLVLNIAKQAADANWIVVVQTVWLNSTTLTETGDFTSETYAILGYEHNNARLAMRLGNPIDAITANVPRRALTTVMVGALPTTGSIPLL